MGNVYQPNWRADLWLRMIALFKLVKATLLVAGGIAAIGLLDPHTAHAMTQWAMELAADRHSHVLDMLITRLVDVDEHTLRMLSVGSLLYSALFYAEGFGLLYDKPWAEYLTIFTTAGLIPFEVYELHRRVTIIKMGVLIANLAIVFYLGWRVTRDRGHAGQPASVVERG
jgi:uncharacterized membrane protein (DUF2068 family)